MPNCGIGWGASVKVANKRLDPCPVGPVPRRAPVPRASCLRVKRLRYGTGTVPLEASLSLQAAGATEMEDLLLIVVYQIAKQA